ncbi:cobyrinate a,c-diamide synthase [Ruminiclostridium papyrosolvens]|uniref:cobyrinate a,c-diamide synthase n=1 Tax=Ruminiclostridium papyrosolvens TaxID=29362 RepID=UPI0005703D2C|nr:cobyrinate a,c-diamide synthase [Ruminiclostridium papyrosolvens]
MAIIKTCKTARIMIAGTGSGCGKTTVTCGILNALVNRGIRTSAFKCGPDYIDPMFHTEITGIKSRNLDTFLLGENNLKHLLDKNSDGNDIAVIEGVMGFYDGLGNDGRHSSYSISRLTRTPVVLVVDPKGMALSISAVINGFRDFMPENNIKGVIINSVSPGLYQMYKPMIEEKTGIRVLGFLPSMPEAVIESRHLGLVTADEIKDIRKKLNIMAKNAEEFIDIDGLVRLAQTAGAMEYDPVSVENKYSCNIAVAKDRAFCFYYEDSLELLREMGAELTYFSPLEDKRLPGNIHGLILGGGYPELYAGKLSSNKTMLKSIKETVLKGLPTYAECGGFMYIQQSISDKQNNKYSMSGVLDGNSTMSERLSRFGYTTLIAKEDNLFCKKGESINAHEFHYSDSDNNGNSFESVKPEGRRKWECIFASDTLFAGYPHIHFYGNIKFAEGFLQKCCNFSKYI